MTMPPDPTLVAARRDPIGARVLLIVSLVVGVLGPWLYSLCFDGASRWTSMFHWPLSAHLFLGGLHAVVTLTLGWPLIAWQRRQGRVGPGRGAFTGVVVAGLLVLTLILLFGWAQGARWAWVNAPQVAFVLGVGGLSGAIQVAWQNAVRRRISI